MKKKPLSETLAENLARLMDEDPDIDTQGKLATRTGWRPGAESGVSQQHISRILKGELSVGLEVLESLAVGVGCEPWELLIDDDAAREAAFLRILSRPTVVDNPHGKIVHMSRRKKKASG